MKVVEASVKGERRGYHIPAFVKVRVGGHVLRVELIKDSLQDIKQPAREHEQAEIRERL